MSFWVSRKKKIAQKINDPPNARIPGGKKNRIFFAKPSSGHSREPSSNGFPHFLQIRSGLPSLTL